MQDKRPFFIQQFSKFVPQSFAPMLADLLIEHPIQFKITQSRKTKLGDFRYPVREGAGGLRITINGDLNPYQFLVTTVHEFAHFITYKKYGRVEKPHGKEWQKEYRDLMSKYIQTGWFPKNIEIALVNSLISVKASSCSDIELMKVLNTYDKNPKDETILDELPKNATFVLQGRTFIKGMKRRTRIECVSVDDKRTYLVSALANVKWIKHTDER